MAYDGTNYHGWQVQPGAVTIEQVLNEKLTELLGEPIEVIGASRTDSGVHAMGNVAVFDTEHRMPADKICFALNQRLPGRHPHSVIYGSGTGLAPKKASLYQDI